MQTTKMSDELIKKYTVKIPKEIGKPTEKATKDEKIVKKTGSFHDIAKNHMVDKKGVEKNLSLLVDKILYGKE